MKYVLEPLSIRLRLDRWNVICNGVGASYGIAKGAHMETCRELSVETQLPAPLLASIISFQKICNLGLALFVALCAMSFANVVSAQITVGPNVHSEQTP